MAEPNIDPREGLVNRLLADIPDNACVIVFNQTFEERILKELSESFQKHKDKLQTIINNIRDLMVPFKDKAVYYWQMNGSCSIKAVLPALIPELNYKELEIGSEDMAMDAYHAMCRSQDPSEVEKIRAALFEYCKFDTLAMVKILNQLKEFCR